MRTGTVAGIDTKEPLLVQLTTAQPRLSVRVKAQPSTDALPLRGLPSSERTFTDVADALPILLDAGSVSHQQAMEKAEKEYRKYQVKTLSPVEQAYLDTIKKLEKEAKEKSKKDDN